MHSEWTDLLSGYLDGELDPVSRRRLESHLERCGPCAAVRDDLARLVASAPRYRGTEPGRRVWAAIAREIDGNRVVPIRPATEPARRFAWRHLIAAGLTMVAVGGGGAWYLATRATVPSPAFPGPAAEVVLTGAPGASSGYDAAVAELEATLAAQRSRLDTATVRVLEESLTAIDQAVAEARAAIQRDTANRYLSTQIAVNLRKKVALLRLATRTIAAET